jgi:arginine decarboxylase
LVVDFHQKFFSVWIWLSIYDWDYQSDKIACDEAEVDVPHIFTEFGSFTVGESGGAIYQILYQKQQNDRENGIWLILLLLLLPDTWAINKRFIMLAVNRWNETYERVLLGGLTCDSDDYYNSEQNMNAIYRNTIKKNHCTSVF